MTAAPGTIICSINNDKDMLVDIDDIPTTQELIHYYLEAPAINTKTYTYHARIHILCMRPLFIILKNNNFMQWLIENRIYLEENRFIGNYTSKCWNNLICPSTQLTVNPPSRSTKININRNYSTGIQGKTIQSEIGGEKKVYFY
jgi:hypothetical protein